MSGEATQDAILKEAVTAARAVSDDGVVDQGLVTLGQRLAAERDAWLARPRKRDGRRG